MKKAILILCLMCFSFYGFSQENEEPNHIINPFFTQFDLSIPIKGNPNRNNEYVNGVENTNKNWFVPDGLNAKFGFGIQKNRWIGLSVHSGIDWKATEKLVAVPIYANFRISPAISSESRITLQMGYGKGFALGRENLSGAYKKISLGIETDDDIIIFIEFANYDIKVNEFDSVGSISLGIAYRAF